MHDLFGQVWGTTTAVVGAELIRAIGHAGGYVAAAYTDGHLVGGSLGFLGRHVGAPSLHSHVTGILPGVRRSGVGRAMKLHQRAWAAERDLQWITWTFDPLVRRNAWFNIAVLGVAVHEYLVDFYGPIGDSLNGDGDTDRLLVAWAVGDGGPTEPPPVPTPGATLVPTPEDVVALRRTDPAPPVTGATSAPRARRRAGGTGDGGRLHPRRRLRRRPGRRCVMTGRLCELREIRLPLVAPFQTSFGTQTSRRILLVRAEVERDGVVTEGWGECVAGDEPTYSPEYVDGAALVIRQELAPRLAAVADLRAADVAHALAPVRGHSMAKAVLEMAVLDAELRAEGRSFADLLGVTRDRIPSGVSVGIHPTIDELLATVSGYLDDGYVRVKLKIEPGMDLEPVAAVRDLVGPDVPLQVDANAAYTRHDAAHLARLDAFDLLLIEQPLAEDDLLGHAALARAIGTPVCLDESITSLTVCADAIDVGAAEIVNIKAGRVGGYLTARRIHDLCRERGIPVWCGGMLETGIGRAANAALAGMDGFTLPGDVSASRRFWAQDIVTEPIEVIDGHVAVPAGPGFGFTLDREFLDVVTASMVDLAGAACDPLDYIPSPCPTPSCPTSG